VKAILALYWRSLGRLKKSSWGKNSIFMIIGIVIAVGALTLSMLLFESYEQTLSMAFKVSQPDIVIRHVDRGWTSEQKDKLAAVLASYTDEIKAQDAKYSISAILANKDINKPVYIESFNNENIKYNSLMYPFSNEDRFNLENNEIILGSYLAADLNLAKGDEVEVVLPNSIRFSIFGLVKKSEKFIIKDVYKTGLYEIDVTRAIINQERMLTLADNHDSPLNYSLLLNNRTNENSSLLTRRINSKLLLAAPSLYAYDVFSNNTMIFSALALQKIMIFLILNIIVIVAGFNVISTISTIIIEKANEIGILMTLGLKRKEIKTIYFSFSLMLSHIGIFGGMGIGTLLAYWLTNQDFISLKGDIYFIDKILIDPSLTMLGAIYLTTLIIISLTIFFSLRGINKLSIINIMRK